MTIDQEMALVLLYKSVFIDPVEKDLGEPMSFPRRLELAKRVHKNKIALALAGPSIRVFSERDPYSQEQCLYPFLGVSTQSFKTLKGIYYEFDFGTGRLFLSISRQSAYKIIDTVLKDGFPASFPVHIELILPEESEKIHCFRKVTQITWPKEGEQRLIK